MALVVTSRSPDLVEVALPPLGTATRRGAALGRLTVLAVVAAIASFAALGVEALARALPVAGYVDLAEAMVGVVAVVLALATCVAAWLVRRDHMGVLLSATLAAIFALVRALSTAVLVSVDLSTIGDVTATALGLCVLGAQVWTVGAVAADLHPQAARAAVDAPRAELFRRVAEVTAFVVFAVSLSGAAVRAVGASWACAGGAFPDCNGLGVLPFGRDPLADVQLYHRLLSYMALGLVAWLAIEAFRTQRALAGVPRMAVALFGLTLADAAFGAASVTAGVPPLLQVAHAAASLATWCAAVALVVRAHTPRGIAVAPGVQGGGALLEIPHGATTARLVVAYIQLTKPRVMSLLLATTATAMVIAARGMPDIGLLIATLLGGALMSGGAGAINHYVDRDIDPLMGRTAWRPIPSGVIAPRDALRFGIALAFIASGIFVLFVNVLACFLAILGLLGYVFIYTLWLKRSTPSNIVIGGAAGAIPPLVGWAAVTHEIGSLTAWYLFAIIFFWTPPHFWALSLLIRQHYERAGVPMLPVVRGEDETRLQIVLYSVLLVVLTLVLSPFGMMGGIYFAAALILGGLFILDAVRLLREATRAAARRLYLYSMLYLFVLFAAMAVDRAVS